jgi:hypothetical protein
VRYSYPQRENVRNPRQGNPKRTENGAYRRFSCRHPSGAQSPSAGTQGASIIHPDFSCLSLTPTSRSTSRTEASGIANAIEHVQTHLSYCDQRSATSTPLSRQRCPSVPDAGPTSILSILRLPIHSRGTFDPDMFVEDLTQCLYRLCSPFLVDVLLFLASMATLSPKS